MAGTLNQDLIAALYRAAADGGDWTGFLTDLCAQSRAGQAVLVAGPSAAGPVAAGPSSAGRGAEGHVWAAGTDARRSNLPASGGATPALAALFAPGGTLAAFALRPGRTYDLAEVLPPDAAPHTTRDALEAQGIRYLRIMRVPIGAAPGAGRPSGAAGADALLPGSLWLAIARGVRDFDAVHGAALTALAPHLEVAAAIHHAARTARLRAARGAQAYGGAGLGWVAFGPRGQVTDMDAAARAVLDTVPGVTLQPGARPACADVQVAAALSQALQRIARGARAVPVRLCESPAVQILLEPADMIPDLRPDPSGTASGQDAGVLGILRGPAAGGATVGADATVLLRDLFGLTSAEARLALCLTRGASIAGAAGELGVTIHTARSCSKQIYAKLGVAGQGGVIGAVLRSVAGLRPGH